MSNDDQQVKLLGLIDQYIQNTSVTPYVAKFVRFDSLNTQTRHTILVGDELGRITLLDSENSSMSQSSNYHN